jgi:hypothetical protein
VSIVIHCPNCERPNGTRFPTCMYCGTELPPPEEGADGAGENGAGGGDGGAALDEGIDPELLAALPERMRSAFLGGATSSRSQSPPSGPAPAVERPRRKPSIDIPASFDPTDLPEPMSVDDEDWGEDQEVAATDSYREVDDRSAISPLLRGRGPWGPRGAPARVLLLPAPSYRRKVPWLRARLHNQLGLDAYTCNMYLQRDVPVFLAEFPTEEGAQQLAENLTDGGMRVLCLTRHQVEEFPIAFRATRADVKGLDIRFEGVEGQSLTLDRSLLQVAVFGEIMPPTTPTGPLVERSFWRVKPARAGRSFDEVDVPYWLLEFIVAPPGPNVRLRADDFDFSFLRSEGPRSSLLSLRKLPEMFAAPGAELENNDQFKRLPRIKREVAPEGAVEMAWSEEELLFAEYTLLESLARQIPLPAE